MVENIRILDKKTINQIAAGEVVERPASVVKELLENSIDAKSTKIIIEIESAGRKLIRVTDNGSGIPTDDMCIAFEKHSTSKISTINDVYKLSTMGFRGEALASIAAVARVECTSCFGENLTGRKIVIEGGELKSNIEVGCAKGTTLKIKDLFFNTPARNKYLKSDQTELTHIIDAVTRLAICHHNINFKLIHNHNELLNFPGTKNHINNLVNIYGKELVRNLVPIVKPTQQDYEITNKNDFKIKISGFIGKPSITRSDRNFQSIFVNGRYVECQLVTEAIKQAYHTLVMKHRHPIVILFIEVDPGKVDVNISPTKLQIRFETEDLVYNELLQTVQGTLRSYDLIPEVKITQKPKTVSLKAITTLGIGKPGIATNIPVPSASGTKINIDSRPDAELDREKRSRPNRFLNQSIFQQDKSWIKNKELMNEDTKSPTGEQSANEFISSSIDSNLPGINPIGQILDTYILAQAEDNLLIIDQHAASERIMYERIKNRYETLNMSTQELLEPIELELAPRELGLLRTNIDMLSELHFAIDEMGENRFYVKGIPIILGRIQSPEVIHDIINDLLLATKDPEHDQIKDKMMQIMACKAAIKAGKPMNIPEINQLLRDLYDINNPYTCAHGRPTIISVTENQLRKLFKRIV